jgi:regulatory protein
MKTQSLRLSAMNFLAIREHSVFQLKKKLQKKYFESDLYSDEDIDKLVLDLLSDNLLSDERFTEVFIRSKMNKGFGPVKINYELKSNGIAKHIIDENMNSKELSWFTSIEKAWNKKFSRVPASHKDIDNKEKLKQSRYLYQRGFSFDLIDNFLKTKIKDIE